MDSLLIFKMFSLTLSITLASPLSATAYLYNGDNNVAWTHKGTIMLRLFVRKVL